MILKNLDRVFSRVSGVTNTISAAILLVSVTLFGLNSLLRFIFKFSILWADEFSVYVFLVGFYLAFVDMDYSNKALSVNFLYDKMKKGSVGKFIFDLINWAISIFIACLLTYSGYTALRRAIRLNTVGLTTKIPYSYLYALILVGIIIWLVYWLCSPLIKIGRKGADK